VALGKALRDPKRDSRSMPKLLTSVFSSLREQAEFLFRNSGTRVFGTLADMVEHIIATEVLRPILVVGDFIMIDVPASGDACLMNDDCSRQSVDYRSIAAKFRQKASLVLQAEVQAAKIQYEKIHHALLHFQGYPKLFVDRCSRPSSSALSPMWCVIADIGSGATDFLPIYAEMLVAKISANRSIVVTIMHVDTRGNLHCRVRSTFTPDVVECFNGESVQLRQPDFEDMTAMRNEALECRKNFLRCGTINRELNT
jgi:hypothetical protein